MKNLATTTAQGTQYKGGLRRRFAVTLDEAEFLELKAFAVKNSRSLSNQAAVYLQQAMSNEAFRYLSNEVASIPQGYRAPLDDRTTAEMMADLDLKS